jgi:hypothetical protein
MGQDEGAACRSDRSFAPAGRIIVMVAFGLCRSHLMAMIGLYGNHSSLPSKGFEPPENLESPE